MDAYIYVMWFLECFVFQFAFLVYIVQKKCQGYKEAIIEMALGEHTYVKFTLR